MLLAREAHFPATIADLYDPEKMPADLREAHDRNDEVVERIYIGPPLPQRYGAAGKAVRTLHQDDRDLWQDPQGEESGGDMSDYVLFQMWGPFRQSLIDGHLFYVGQARKRLLSQFDDIEADADRAAEERSVWLAKQGNWRSRWRPVL